jgi:hypothetical protein
VSGGRTSDEKIPRAWIVLNQSGKRRGEAASVEALKAWTQESLAKYKWLRGGIEVIDEVIFSLSFRRFDPFHQFLTLDPQEPDWEGIEEGPARSVRTSSATIQEQVVKEVNKSTELSRSWPMHDLELYCGK